MPRGRDRHRYLMFRVASERGHRSQEIADAIQRGVLHLYGLLGLSQISPVLLEFDEERQAGILRCIHAHLRRMRASLAYVTEIGGSEASITVDRVSGTIRALRACEKRA